MRANGTTFLVLAAAAAGVCASLAGCAGGPGAHAPAASTLAARRQAQDQPHGQVTPTSRPAAPAGHPSQAPAAGRTAAGRTAAAALASGLYTDGPDGTPHYILSFSSRGGSTFTGSASFLYQDGRIATAGSYAATLSGTRKITLTLGNGKVMPGTYAGGHLSLPGCAAALPLAKIAGGCTFTYHGHVP
jgi:hypothetical protein